MKENGSILIFPEGTRSGTHKLQPLKRGSLLLMFESKARVIPIALNESYKLISKGKWFINKSDVTVRFGKPLDFSKYNRDKDDYEKAIKELRGAIEGML